MGGGPGPCRKRRRPACGGQFLRSLAIVAGTEGRQDRAGELLDQAIGLAQESGDDQLLRLLLGSSAEMNIWLGRYQVAERPRRRSLACRRDRRFLGPTLLLAELGWVAILRGDPPTASASLSKQPARRRPGHARVPPALRLGGQALMRLGDLAAVHALDRAYRAESLKAPGRGARGPLFTGVPGVGARGLGTGPGPRRRGDRDFGLGPCDAADHSAWVLGMVSLLEGDLGSAGERFLEGLSTAETGAPRHEATFTWVWPRQGLPRDDWRGGETRQAALDLWRNLGTGWAWSIALSCWQSSQREHSRRTAELLGAAGSLRDRAGARPRLVKRRRSPDIGSLVRLYNGGPRGGSEDG